jgi:hypothetical protein
MGSYTVYDFVESLDRSKIEKDDVEKVIAAWGSGEPIGYSEWEGGFLMSMKDGRTCYLWGWCDTSGWGCQDGAEVTYDVTPDDREIMRGVPQHMGGYIEALFGGAIADKWEHEWDEDPIDLNRWLAGEITDIW